MAIQEKKWRFERGVVEHAPEEPGVFALWEKDELVYVGRAASSERGIRTCLLEHLGGARGECTRTATHYSWEISLWPTLREGEVLADFLALHKRKPRCNDAAC